MNRHLNAYCYYDNPAAPSFPAELIDRWHDTWRHHGFTTFMLTEKDAREHPRFQEMNDLVATLPTSNERRFERACWLRWLAYALHAPGIFTDYDNINFGLKPAMVPRGPLVPLDLPPSGSFIYGEREQIEAFIEFFRQADKHVNTWKGQPTISDLFLFRHFYKGQSFAYSVLTDTPGHWTAPVVHFSNEQVKPEWKFANRWLAIDYHRLYRARAKNAPLEDAVHTQCRPMVLVVGTYSLQQQMFLRHLPYWQRHGLPIWVVSPIDTPVTLPGDYQHFHIGRNGYSRWPKAEKIIDMLRMFSLSDCRQFVWFETDAICLKKDIEPVRGLVASIHDNGDRERFYSPNIVGNPFRIDRESAGEMLRAAEAYPEISEEGHDDRILSALADLCGVSVRRHSEPYFLENTILPEHHAKLRQAILDGAVWIHGIKDEATLNVVLEAAKEKGIEL